MIWDFNIVKAAGLVLRTWPFLMLRLVFFSLMATIFIAIATLGGKLGHLYGPAFKSSLNETQLGLVGILIAIPIGFITLRAFRAYSLYLVKAAHIADIVRLMDGRSLNGQTQLAFGLAAVREKFAQSSSLVTLDHMTNCALKRTRACPSQIGRAASNEGPLVCIARSLIEYFVGFVDEIILAHNMRAKSKDAWDSSADAIVLYAQNRGVMVKNAVWLTFFSFVFGGAVTYFSTGPMAAFFAGSVGPSFIYAVIASVVVAIVMIEVVFAPFAAAALSEVFFKATDGQAVHPEWELKLDLMSEQFGLIRDRADENSANLYQQL